MLIFKKYHNVDTAQMVYLCCKTQKYLDSTYSIFKCVLNVSSLTSCYRIKRSHFKAAVLAYFTTILPSLCKVM